MLQSDSDSANHREAVALVGVDCVAEQLRSSRDRDALLVSQLVQSALAAKIPLPERAICRATSHRAKQVRIDLDDFLNTLRSCYEMSKYQSVEYISREICVPI